jgi:polyphosphate glucokinase
LSPRQRRRKAATARTQQRGPENGSTKLAELTPGKEFEKPKAAPAPRRILVVDIGGSKIKVLASGQTEPKKTDSGRSMTPARMVDVVSELAQQWEYEAISLGFPGLVGDAGPRSEPGNLGPGWVGFDFATAFGKPVRILNDAAMQALGSYEGGRMLFLGLGTGLGSTFICGNVIVTLELGQLTRDGGARLSEVLGRKGLKQIGKKAWRRIVAETVHSFLTAFTADYVVLGGGNSDVLRELPTGARLGHNLTAFRGGFRLWNLEDVQTLSPDADHDCPKVSDRTEWRVL